MTAPQSPPIPTNPRPGPVAEAVAKSQASEPRQATFDEVYKQEVKASTTPGPRFVAMDEGPFACIRDTLAMDSLICRNRTESDIAKIKRYAALLNNAYPAAPQKAHAGTCEVCGVPTAEHTAECSRHAWVANGGLVPHAEGVAR